MKMGTELTDVPWNYQDMTLLYCADINILIIKPKALYTNCNVNIPTFGDTDRFLRYKFNEL